jgi:hypothetical protein
MAYNDIVGKRLLFCLLLILCPPHPCDPYLYLAIGQIGRLPLLLLIILHIYYAYLHIIFTIYGAYELFVVLAILNCVNKPVDDLH